MVGQIGFIRADYTASEGLVRIQYKCLVLVDVFPDMKLRGRSAYFAAPKGIYKLLTDT
jgi:hypothetical protein